MKKKITFAALVWAALLALSGCGDKPENVSESVVSVTLPNKIDIFNTAPQRICTTAADTSLLTILQMALL